MSSFFSIIPSQVKVTAGVENTFTFSLTYNSADLALGISQAVSARTSSSSAKASPVQKLAESCAFYIDFSYGNESTEIGRAEDIAKANIQVVEGDCSGLKICPGPASQKPYWILFPIPQANSPHSNEKKVFSIQVSKLLVNNQKGATLMSIHPYGEKPSWESNYLLINKLEGIFIQDMTLWRETWAKNEKFSFTVNTWQGMTFAFDGQSVSPQVENSVSYSTSSRSLLAQNFQTGFVMSQEFPIYALEAAGEKDSFLLKWQGSSDATFGNYQLNGKAGSCTGEEKVSVDTAAVSFSSTLAAAATDSSANSSTATAFFYELRTIPLPVINTFTAKKSKLQLAPANAGFMEPQLLEQPGILLQIAPYEPFPPSPEPVKNQKVEVSWDVSGADQIEIQGQLVTDPVGHLTLDLPCDTTQVSIKVSLCNGFFREQQAAIKEGY